MLSRADLLGARPAAIIEPPSPVTASANARQDTFNRLEQIALGRQLQAAVLSLFDDGTYLVRIADTTARMNLPNGTKVGDTLSMTMLAHTPRPTFLLGATQESSTASLSAAGRLVDSLLRSAQEQGASPTVTGKVPLTSSPAALAAAEGAPAVAAAMQHALEFSGLFYESHLHELTNGTRSLSTLMHEPQAEWQAPEATLEAPPNLPVPHAVSPQLLDRLREFVNSEHTLNDLLSELQTQAGNASITDADTISRIAKPDTMTPESIQLVSQQLHVLEQRQFVWQGELFPGLPMEWEVNEDASHDKPSSGEPVWNSTVRFELPKLGCISATIRLVGQRVHVQIHAASENAATLLRIHGTELGEALRAAGAPLDSLSVKQNDEA